MSSFGDGNTKTWIESELSWIAKEAYSENFMKTKKRKGNFC